MPWRADGPRSLRCVAIWIISARQARALLCLWRREVPRNFSLAWVSRSTSHRRAVWGCVALLRAVRMSGACWKRSAWLRKWNALASIRVQEISLRGVIWHLPNGK
ncbi:unnamed protein product [Chondrus crispus]|uniref:Secreted protein n=1 Tax=Chondrus crispus TaxID=2769 RepID=R7QSH3_CHOCR|nr:unnamed protein product [Chondrus crispus]CDF40693.1 unnamed protein product [Chondrus crispus]|eukprot:XP_005710987.1 unnamed protein product [Chondrus crispus]